MRRWSAGGAVATAAASGVGICLLGVAAATVARSRYPIAKVVEAERANQRAVQAEASRYAPGDYQRYQAALSSAQELLDEQQRRWVFRRYGSAETLLEQAQGLADLAAVKAAENRQRRRFEVSDELRRFEEAILKIRGNDARFARLPSARKTLLRAEISLATAKWLWDHGDYDTAGSHIQSEARSLNLLEDQLDGLIRTITDPHYLSKWNESVKATIARSARMGEYAIVVNKYQQTLRLYHAGHGVAEYPVDLGSSSFGEKRYKGDAATPEGRYHVVKKLGTGQSRYYKALVINYPNDQDLQRYRQLKRGLPSPPGVGGQIEIHGRGGRNENWTAGCIAVDDGAMDELFPLVKVGTPVTIVANETLQDHQKMTDTN